MSTDIKTLSERIKPNAWLTPGETGNILAASMQEAAELRAALALAQAPSAPQPMSEHNARFAIDGAIQYGREDRNKPPSDDHWLMEYWLIGQQLRELGKTGWDNVTPLDPAEPVVVAPSAPVAASNSVEIDGIKTGAPVAPSVERKEFEAWAVGPYGPWTLRAMSQRVGEDYGIRDLQFQWDYWQARAALSVKAESTPEIPEDWEAQREQLRAQYPGIDGEFKVFDVVITTELDCKLEEGEYGVEICELVNGCVGEHDFGRIEDAVSEVIDTLNLPDEGQTIIRVYESGEREDVFWNSYWRVAAPTPPTKGEAVRVMVDSTVSMPFPSRMTDAERSQAIIDKVFPAGKGEA